MPDPKNAPAGSEPPPAITFKNPRRTSPENSVTLRHHRLAREASKRHSPPNVATAKTTQLTYPRRNSSGESNQTGISDPKKWFDLSNENATGHLDTTAMDVDPPFYQKETDSSNDDGAKYAIPSQSPAYRFVQSRTPALRPDFTHSSSADDYRSVIDDLTIENKRLKEELKKFKYMGPDSLRKDKLFEVKFHGLPGRKKRELEATLRDFTTSLDNSSVGASPNRKKAPGKSKGVHSSASKHASSSSGSNSRPVDSAYASMSIGHNSSVPSLPAQTKYARQRSNQEIENYLRDIPEGLWPRPTVMTEKEKKKLVVKRLEHLFTGKMCGSADQQQLVRAPPPQPINEDTEMETPDDRALPVTEAAREATIRPRELGLKTSLSRDTGSASNTHSQSQSHSTGDPTDSKDNGIGSGNGSGSRHGSGSGGRSGNNTSPQNSTTLPEQRPTRPRDLDPDRKQVPSENMDYIRHLGLVAPTSQTQFSSRDVSPDAEGWVYLNLLCNLAQLHILNVTPDFIRHAVSERSAKFQLSPDGRKIRWRGGAEGTRFSSDSSGSNSQRNQSSDDTDGSNGQEQRKKQKTQPGDNDVIPNKTSKFGLGVQDSNSSESFHYKPLFVHHPTESSEEQPSLGEETGSSYGPPEESNLGLNSRWGQSGVSTGMSQRKRRRDGAIIYYSGAPFCTDLSGDFGEVSADTYDMTSSGDQVDQDPDMTRPLFSRSTSGSSIPFRPLGGRELQAAMMDLDDTDPPDLTSGETDDDLEADFPWSDRVQHAPLLNLEASGLGGINPDDHFVVVVSTRRPKKPESDIYNKSDDENSPPPTGPRLVDLPSQETTDSKATTTDAIIGKLASMTTESPGPVYVKNIKMPAIQIEYLMGKFRRLPPVPLPPPAFYFPSGDDSELDDDDDSFGDDDSDSSQSLMSRRAILEDDPSDNADLSGNDEEDEHSDGGRGYDASGSISPDKMEDIRDVGASLGLGGGHRGRVSNLSKMTTGSSVATAGGAGSGYNSSMEGA